MKEVSINPICLNCGKEIRQIRRNRYACQCSDSNEDRRFKVKELQCRICFSSMLFCVTPYGQSQLTTLCSNPTCPDYKIITEKNGSGRLSIIVFYNSKRVEAIDVNKENAILQSYLGKKANNALWYWKFLSEIILHHTGIAIKYNTGNA